MIKPLISAFFVGALFLSSAALANETVAPQDKELARDRFVEGVEAFVQNDYQTALKSFEQSYQLFPKVSVLYNIGMCQKALYMLVPAIESFKNCLNKGEELGPSDRAQVEENMQELMLLVGELAFRDAPLGAVVKVDGTPVAQTPLDEPLLLDPGSYFVALEKDGFEPFETTVTVASGGRVIVKGELTERASPVEVVELGRVGLETLATEDTELPQTILVPNSDLADEPSGSRGGRALTTSGIVSLALGIGAMSWGIASNVQYNRVIDDMHQTRNVYEEATPDERESIAEDYMTYSEPWYNNRNAMIVGYVSGGVLLAVGTTLLLFGLKSQNQSKKKTVSVTPKGVTVAF